MNGEDSALIKCCHRTHFFLTHQTHTAEVLTTMALAARVGGEVWNSSVRWGQDEKCIPTHLEGGPLHKNF